MFQKYLKNSEREPSSSLSHSSSHLCSKIIHTSSRVLNSTRTYEWLACGKKRWSWSTVAETEISFPNYFRDLQSLTIKGIRAASSWSSTDRTFQHRESTGSLLQRRWNHPWMKSSYSLLLDYSWSWSPGDKPNENQTKVLLSKNPGSGKWHELEEHPGSERAQMRLLKPRQGTEDADC